MKISLIQRLKRATPEIWARVAACFALAALVFMVLPLFVNSPLLLVVGMSVSHVLGLAGVLFFATAVLREVLVGLGPIEGKPIQHDGSGASQSPAGK